MVLTDNQLMLLASLLGHHLNGDGPLIDLAYTVLDEAERRGLEEKTAPLPLAVSTDHGYTNRLLFHWAPAGEACAAGSTTKGSTK